MCVCVCKFSVQHALKVDVTSLINKAAGGLPFIVVVASGVTRSRDVVNMVVQKLGMDRRQVSLMQLVAVIDHKPRPNDGKQTCVALYSILCFHWDNFGITPLVATSPPPREECKVLR